MMNRMSTFSTDSYAALAIFATMCSQFSCASSVDELRPMSVDAFNACEVLETAAQCDTKRCIDIVCWQRTGSLATDCPHVIRADFDAIAQVIDLHHDTYPTPNQCGGDETPLWNIETALRDEHITSLGCTTWESRNEFGWYPSLVKAEPRCVGPPPFEPRF